MMIFEFEETPVRNARMKVIGVGGAGGNAVNRMIDAEWDTPVGRATTCGGDALMRRDAFAEAGGFNPGALVAALSGLDIGNFKFMQTVNDIKISEKKVPTERAVAASRAVPARLTPSTSTLSAPSSPISITRALTRSPINSVSISASTLTLGAPANLFLTSTWERFTP